MEILCFYAGMIFVYLDKIYALIFIAVLLYFRLKPSFIYAFFIAILWGFLHQWWSSPRGMPTLDIIPEAQLIGEIASIPTYKDTNVQFTFLASKLNGQPIKTLIHLNCYQHCPQLHAGEYWQLTAKLKKPRNFENPGRFDYVNWLKARHIHWIGAIRKDSFKRVENHDNTSFLLPLRESLCDKLARLNPDKKTLGIIQALTIGVNSQIDKSEWDLFRHTGVTHLIDISGSHIGIITAVSFFIIRFIWSRMGRCCVYCPAPTLASMISLILAFSYTLLSGFAIPAQRAFLASLFMLVRFIYPQRFGIWQAWRYALLAVLIFEPHSVLLVGFYLSFIGVAILMLVNQCMKASKIHKKLALQLACMLGLMPLSLFWFSYGAINGLMANLLAIPWVELWMVPLGLTITLLPQGEITSFLMEILKHSTALLLWFLQWVDIFSGINLTFSFSEIISPLILMFSMCVGFLLPLKQFIFPLVIMSLMAIIPHHPFIKVGTAHIDIMDVGQGLAVLVRTKNHSLIYDTGMKFFGGGDSAKTMIIPYLKTLNIKHLDKIIISHPDLDHRGGLASLEEQYAHAELIVDSPAFYHSGISCHDYPAWSWDGVSFRFFAIKGLEGKKNNRSCVLQVATPKAQLLLTGDIEKSAEEYLTTTYQHALASTYMVIPHHASKTSSSPSFLAQAAPKYAIASYGFDNRYHFPHPSAIAAYRQKNIPIYTTVDCGMITIELDTESRMRFARRYCDPINTAF